MYTFYELLGVRPDDDVDAIKAAYRSAVKANHPDLFPGDPEAARRLRQIILAHSVLTDASRRATYDQMLGFDFRRLGKTSKRAILAQTVRKIVSDAIAVAVVAIVLLGGYALVRHIPQAAATLEPVVNLIQNLPARPSTAANASPPAARTEQPSAAQAEQPAAAAVEPPAAAKVELPAPVNADQPAVASGEQPRPVKPEPPAAATAEQPAVATTDPQNPDVTGSLSAGSSAAKAVEQTMDLKNPAPSAASSKALDPPAPPRNPVVRDARFFRQKGIALYRDGELAMAVAALGTALRLDPAYRDAYIDRAIVFYRMGKVRRAFADLAEADRLARMPAARRSAEARRARLQASDRD